MNIKKIIFLSLFILLNIVILAFISYTSKERDTFILLFLILEIVLCEMGLMKNHKQLLKSIRFILYIFLIVVMRLMGSLMMGAIVIMFVIIYSVVIDYWNNRYL